MALDLDQLERMVGAQLASESLPSPQRIRELIDSLRVVCSAVTDAQAEELARRFETVHGVTMNIGPTLQERDFEKWLEDARGRIEPYFWNRYKRLLAEKDFSGQVLATMENVTDRVLGLLENPTKAGTWDRRGMVVGQVQSGKTANYIGLICKAADAGYKVLIVIAGIHNNLRNQTQRRIDEGFIGFDSARLLASSASDNRFHIVGVGRFNSVRRPITLTNTLRDFNRATATAVGLPLDNLTQPAVFVVKKNTNTLRNLIEWLRTHNAGRSAGSVDSPMLLIDDEADNASINISHSPEDVSRINGQIRELLALFDRSCYVGYTATPFANIFIDPDTEDDMFGQDLFPRHFIVGLDPPDNYFGPARVFVDGSSDVVRHVDDHEDLLPIRHPIDHLVTGLPESLRTAVRAFVIGRAIRLARGQTGEHNSMLVNVSRFTRVQRQIRNEIQCLVGRIRDSVRVNGAKPEDDALRDSEIAALHDIFGREYATSCGLPWATVQQRLWDSISPVEVVAVNRHSPGSLVYADYPSGFNVIAVGGFSLSRGLTLEGLTVSYFLRNSMMYDTLMQMGRWFGYRPGYEDLCRVWMPEEAEGWYDHIANSIEELRDDLRRMEQVNATPREFGLRVRSHPDTLIVTARNKIGAGERIPISIGLSNEYIETAVLRRDGENLEANRRAVVAFSRRLRELSRAPEDGERVGGGRLVRDVPVQAIVDFLVAFRNHPGSLLTDPQPVRRYIEERSDDELVLWDVLFTGTARQPAGALKDRSLGFEIACQRRSPGRRSDGQTLLITNKQRVASRGMEKVGLSDSQIRQAEANYRKEKTIETSAGSADSRRVNYPDRIYRRVRTRPLLMVHLLAIGGEDDDLSGNRPVVAWGMSFPETQYEEKTVEYVVNPTWFREHYGSDEEDDRDGE